MNKVYRIGAIGFAHSHIDSNLKAFSTLGDKVKFVACADIEPRVPSISEEPGTRKDEVKQAVKLYGMKRYDDYKKMLDENELDIVLVCSENAFHPYVCEEILRRGIHVVLEKPIAASMQGALRIARAAKEGGAKVFVNWPSTWYPAVRYAKKLCDEGKIGKIFKITYRNVDSQGALSYGQKITDGEKGREWWHQSDVGGGALLDYCCYGACLSHWFTGEKPVSAYGLKANFNSPYASAEDYATITVRFPDAVAILEGSWTTVNTGVPNGPIIYGLEGTMVVNKRGEVEIYKTRHKEMPDEVLTPPPLPEGRENLGKDVINHLETGADVHPTLSLENNLTAMSILDAGIRSAQSGKMELVNDGTWCVGADAIGTR